MDGDEVARLLAACSNAGRWGPDDELGTLNLITADKRRQAAALVTEGISVSMAAPLSLQHGPATDALVDHRLYPEPGAPMAVVDDVTLHLHGWSTHMDALGHIDNDGTGYNQRRRDEMVTDRGLTANAITAMRDGVFTRCVLLDVTAVNDVAWLAADHQISRAELERAEDASGHRVESGDAVLVHTGLAARFAATGHEGSDARAGLGVDAVLWLHERDVAVFSGDCIELLPGPDPALPLPLHQLGIAAMGLAMLEWPSLDRLLDVCSRLGRTAFLLTVAPLPIEGGTGSPVNPIATF